MQCRLHPGASQPVSLAQVDRYLRMQQRAGVATALALIPFATLLGAMVVGSALGGAAFGLSILLLPAMVTARIGYELVGQRRVLTRARRLLTQPGVTVQARARALWITAGGERVEVPVGDRRLLGLGPARAALPAARLLRDPR